MRDDGTRPDHSPTALEYARRRLIVRRLPLFAFGWLATTLMWLLVLAIAAHVTLLAATVTLVCQIVVLAAAIAICRRDPVAPRVTAAAVLTCVLLGFSSTALFAAERGSAEFVGFLIFALGLASALLFAWGWRAQLIVFTSALGAWIAALSFFQFALPPMMLAAATGISLILSLAIAGGAARAFRVAFFHRASEEEHKRALEVSRDAYRDLAEKASDFIYTADLEGRFTYVNEAAARFAGEPVEALVGAALASEFLIDHPENPDVPALLARVAAGESVSPSQLYVKTANGPAWLEVSISGIRGTDGRVTGIRGIGRDVTERRRAEEARRTSEARYRNIIDTTAAFIARTDAKGRFTFVNEAYRRALAKPLEQLIGQSSMDVVHEDDRAEMLAVMRESLGSPFSGICFNCRILTPGGSAWVKWDGVAIQDKHGVITELQALGHDITTSKAAEDALKASETRYRGLVESPAAFIVRVDPEARFTFVNDAYCRKLGKPLGELLGQPCITLLVHEDDIAETLAALEQTLETPSYRGHVDCRVRTPSGWSWIAWDGCSIMDVQGACVEIQAVGLDVTDRKEAEQALRVSLEELSRSEEKLRLLAQRQVQTREEERKRLSFDLHDDVCQELVGIAIMVESLQRQLQPVPPAAAASLEHIVRYLYDLVEYLRRLARDLRPMLLHDLGLEHCLRSLVEGMSPGSTHVVTRLQTMIPRFSEDSELAVYRIAQEALANAARHAAADSIVLTLGTADGVLRLEVRDDGRGFVLQDRQHSEALGLASMQERALALGGRLEVWSEPGKGTAVRLEFPLPSHAPATAA
jgi:PAS domain S-box-containing protein